MASSRLMETKNGRKFWRITVSRGRGQPQASMRWYWPDGWSKRTAERELAKVATEFESRCQSGEVVTRAERKAAEDKAKAEKAKLRTVKEYAEGVFLPSKEAATSINTTACYRMILANHILPEIGNMLLGDVTPAIIQKIMLSCQKRYAHSTVCNIYCLLSSLFDMAFMGDSIVTNPMLKVKRPAARKDDMEDKAAKALTAEGLNRVFEAAENEPLKWRTWISLAADTACRRGEICGLQWSDVNFETGAVEVKRNIQYTAGVGVYVNRPKNGKARWVDVGPDTLALLKRLRQEQAQSCISPWIFPSTSDTTKPLAPYEASRYFKWFSREYGIDNFHPHILRHTSASIAITNGADVKSVSERLGHSDIAITLKLYTHANEESIRRAGQVVRDALKAAK